MKKQRTNHNTDGIVNCLPQPGQLRNQLHKYMSITSFHLLNLVYPDSSCCRDKVSRAAGRRAGALFFARHLDFFIVTQNSHPLPVLGTVKTNYRDPKLTVHLPVPIAIGMAKNAAPRHGRQHN
jgi:hypothetical protein